MFGIIINYLWIRILQTLYPHVRRVANHAVEADEAAILIEDFRELDAPFKGAYEDLVILDFIHLGLYLGNLCLQVLGLFVALGLLFFC